MRFKEWIQEQVLLLEDARVVMFSHPEDLAITVNGKRVNLRGVEIIDMRFEDWHLDYLLQAQADPNPISLASGGTVSNGFMTMKPNPKPTTRPVESFPPKGRAFSVPLADGRFINYSMQSFFDKEIAVDQKAKWELVTRPDWADFAEFIGNGNDVLKQAKFDRDERISLMTKLQAV